MKHLVACAVAFALATTPARAAADPSPRIVALAPNLVELLFSVGCGGSVVGVGDWARWPPEVEALPRLGGLFDPRLETIAALDPDLAVLLPSEGSLGDQLGALGIETLTVPNETLADIESAAISVAARCGGTRLDGFLSTWRQGLATSTAGAGERVLVVIGRTAGDLTQLIGAGPGTYIDELLARLGAENVLADSPARYPQVSLEAIVAHTPTLIIDLQGVPLAAADRAVLAADWDALRATGRRVVVIDGDHTLVPGPRLPRLFADLAEALGP